jgi:hypothetical protein
MPSTLKITINQNDWNEQLKGWNCNALSVSCLSVVSVRVNGVSPDPSYYVLEKENNLIRWTQAQRPEELVLLVKPIIDEQEDAEKSKQIKLDTVLKFAAVVIPALIAAVSTITVTIINTKKDNNTEIIQKLSQDNKTLSEDKERLNLALGEKEVRLNSLKATIDSLGKLLPKNINRQLVIGNDTLKRENQQLKGQLDNKTSKIASLERQLNNLKNKTGNAGYTVYIHSSTQGYLFPTLRQQLKGAGFPEVNCQGLSANRNEIIYYHSKAEPVAQHAAGIIRECCQLTGMNLVLLPDTEHANEIKIKIQ